MSRTKAAEEKPTRAPWEQMDGEPDAAYRRFLEYRNLGPARSIDAAFRAQAPKRTEKHQRAAGQWKSDSVQFHWQERATAWDIEMLTDAGRDAVIKFIGALDKLAEKTLLALERKAVKPNNWHEIIEAVNILGSFIPAETVAALQSDAAEHRTPAIGATPDAERARR